MDPYEYTVDSNSIPEEEDLDEDQLEKLEQELAPQSSDYYGILNVSKTATEEELKESYKRLCRFFHPDKHNDAEKKKLAESKFQVIQKAYEVLSDPTKRAIYDTYGEEGLNAKWEIGPRLKTPEELRAEYERLARLKREQELENLVRSRGEFHLNLDATQVFDPYDPPVFAGFGQPLQPPPKKKNPLQRLARTQIQQLFMRHSFETQLGPQTQGVIGGSMISRNGIGGGNILGTVRHTFSPKLSGEASVGLLKPRLLTLKTFYNMSSDSFVNTVTQARTIYGPPVLTVTAGRRLFSAATGYITYRTGEWALGSWGGDVSRKLDRSSVALGLAGRKQNGSYNIEIQTGIIASHIALEHTHKLENKMQIRLAGVLSTTGGLSASIGSDHQVTKHTRFGMSLECGVPSGVTIKFRVSRLGQKVVLPILLSTDLDLKLAFFSALVPVTIVLALDQLVLKPRRQKQIKEKIAALREQHAEYLAMRKKEALDAQHLMAEVAQRKKGQEEKKPDGLVIVKAWYGPLESIERIDENDEKLPEDVIDVTTVIQALVNESRLTIPGGHSKTNILGFYDPCLGERKHLRVLYRFQHRLHVVTVSDEAPLICPMRSHVV